MHLLRSGTFHIMCTFFKVIWKVSKVFGIEEIILESGMCSSGSLNGVITGKHYNCALNVHPDLQSVSKSNEKTL